MGRPGNWAEIAMGWERSGEKQRAFASRHGVSVHTLRSWIYERRRKGTPSRLVEVRVVPRSTVATSQAEVALPNGVTVRFIPGTEPAWAAALVKAFLG